MTTPDFDTNKDSDLVGMVEAMANVPIYESPDNDKLGTILSSLETLWRWYETSVSLSDRLDDIVHRLERLERYAYVHEQIRDIQDTHANFNAMLVEHHGRITELETHNHDDDYSTTDHDHDDTYCETGHYHDITCGDSYT